MPLTVIFVRHGESTANIDHVFANHAHIPGNLTPAGIRQAQALAGSLEDVGLTRIYTSPLPRARQTAEIVSAHFGVPVTTTDALREYDVGVDEGCSYTGADEWRWRRYEAVQQAWRSGDPFACHPGGESLDDIERRLASFMKTLASRHRDGDVGLAVGHGGIFHAALPVLLSPLSPGIATHSPLGHGDSIVAVLEHGDWRCVRWGPVALDAGHNA